MDEREHNEMLRVAKVDFHFAKLSNEYFLFIIFYLTLYIEITIA